MKADMRNLLLALLILCLPGIVRANPIERLHAKGWEFEVRAGFNLGGVSPIPLPAEIRSIDRFSPKFNGQLELVAINWMQEHIGLSMGLRFEQLGMKSEAQVKNYQMELAENGMVTKGTWTGHVESNFSGSYLTLPIQMLYRFNSAVQFSGGLFLSYMFDGDFSGFVYDGYFRRGSSTGEKIQFGKDPKTPYSFKDHLAPFVVGMQLGGCAQVYRGFLVFVDLKYGFNSIFKSGFTAMPGAMHTLYLGAGFGYRF